MMPTTSRGLPRPIAMNDGSVAIAAVPGQDRAEVRRDAVVFLGVAGQPDGAGLEMVAVEVLVGADQGKAVAAGGHARQEFGEAHAGIARRDGGERPAKLGRGVGLGIEGVDVARRSPEPQEQHGASPRTRHTPDLAARRPASPSPANGTKSPAFKNARRLTVSHTRA